MQTNSLRYMVVAKAFAAPKGHDHQSSHINRRQQRRDCSDEPESFAKTSRQTELSGHPSLPENLVLGKETREDRHTANRQPARAHAQPGDWHVLTQTTHAAHVLLVVQPRDYRT